MMMMMMMAATTTTSSSSSSSSSSSGYTTSILECFVLLYDLFPFMSVLDAAFPIVYLHDLQVIFTSFSHLFLGLPNDLVAMGFHSYVFFYNSFVWHSVYMPKQA